MKFKLSFVSLVALALSFAALPQSRAQESPFKPDADHTMVPGSIVKVGAGGVADNTITGTATSTAAAATINADSGKVTTEALVTAGLADYTFTLTNSKIAAASKVFVSVDNGTNTQGTTVVKRVTPGAGTAVILIRNQHATEALNGTLKISFLTIQ